MVDDLVGSVGGNCVCRVILHGLAFCLTLLLLLSVILEVCLLLRLDRVSEAIRVNSANVSRGHVERSED